MGEGRVRLLFKEGAWCGEEGPSDTTGKPVEKAREGKRFVVAKRRAVGR